MIGPELSVRDVEETIKAVLALRQDIIKLRNDPQRIMRRQIKLVRDAQERFEIEKRKLQALAYDLRNADNRIDEYDARIAQLRTQLVQVKKRSMLQRMKEMRAAFMALGGTDPLRVAAIAADPANIDEEDIIS